MVAKSDEADETVTLDELDRRILRVVQEDASLSIEEIAGRIGSSKSPVWSRIRRLRAKGVIARQVALLDPVAVGRDEVFFVAVSTNRHAADWLERFTAVVRAMPEIQEAHRLAGEVDYLLKVRVGGTRAFDAFYKRLVSELEMTAVTSSLSMETIKSTTVIEV